LLAVLFVAALLAAAPRACAAAASAQPAPSGLVELPAQPVQRPVLECGSLATHGFSGAPGADFAGAPFKVMSAVIEPAAAGRAEFCLVKAYAAPQVQFELRLPTAAYAGRYLQGGCGAMCGVIGGSLSPPCDDRHAFAGSFAVAFNNSGHVGASGGDAIWAIGAPGLREDFAYRADHVAALAAKAIIAAYYGAPPRRSYFQGCSDGGREGLMEAQRYPGDFDGIVAGSSVSMPAVMERFLWEARSGLAEDGREILTEGATRLLHDAVMAACDGLDGTRDGQIDDPRQCRYDPGALACKPGQAPSACLTEEQVTAARRLYAGPSDGEGHRFFPGGEPYGSELQWSGPAAFTRTGKFAAEAFIKYLALPGSVPADFTWRSWKFDLASFQRLQAGGAVYDPRDPDLRRFRNAGGRMILWQGAADGAAGVFGMPEYYQAVRDTVGGLEAARRFVRFFLVPGVYHCRGGYIPYEEDFLGAVVNWVERDRAPDSVLAVATLDGGKIRRRPLFAYPVRARYLGGDVDDPGSFAGQAPDQPPDDHYDWVGGYGHAVPPG
jgi:feruloyl esterase